MRFESGGLNLNWHLILDPNFHCGRYTELMTRQDHLLSFASSMHLFEECSKHLNTGTCDKFAEHPGSEFVLVTVSKLVRWSFFFVCPGLLRSGTTETPMTKSESCCVRSHFSRLSQTFILHLPTFPTGGVVEHAREDDPVWKALRYVPGLG